MAGKFTLRKAWFQIHLWTGVALFLVLIPVSVTGSLLVWHDALDAMLNPHRYETTGPARLPLQTYADAARQRLGGDQPVASLRLPEHGQGPVIVSAPLPRTPGEAPTRGRPPQQQVFLDPGSAKVLDVGRSDQGVVRWLHVFHGSLMVPGLGRKIVGWLGWLMLALALTGIWLWWPRNGKVLRGFRWRRAPLTSSNLHHMTGIWVSIPLAVLAFTGAYISFPQTFRGIVGAIAGEPAAVADRGAGGEKQGRGQKGQGGEKAGGPPGGGRGPQRPVATTALTPDQAVSAVRAAAPGAEILAVTWPTVRKAEWSVRVQPEAGPPVAYGVGDATGVAKLEGRGPDAASKTARLMRVIHDGAGTGFLWQLIIFIAGIAPALLGITGLIMWLKNRGARRARNAM